MNATSIGMPTPSPQGEARDFSRLRGEQREFQSLVGRAAALVEGTPDGADKARDAAEQFVAQALVQPVFKSVRASNGAAEPFRPNAAEQSFRGMMDAQLAQRLVKSRNWALVDHIAASLQKGPHWREGGSA